jgi:hypothetical protein
MTDQNPSTHATRPAAGATTVTVACVHIGAAEFVKVDEASGC